MLEEKIYNDYVQALKAGLKEKAQFLSFLRAEFKNQAINLRKPKLDDPQVLEALKSQKKRLLESKEFIDQSQRKDLIDKVNAEIAMVAGYLPESMPREELVKIISQIIQETGANSPKDMGKVMKLVLEKTAGRADSKETSQLVKERLSPPS